MQKVVLSGYYGFDNAGDEALLWSIAGKLRELKPDLRVIVLSANPSRTGELYGVEAVPRANPLALLMTLRRADLLISGGGSLLQDVTSWRSIIYYLGVIALARLLGTPVMYYAQGVGPIRRGWARWLTRFISDRVNLITLRDEDSRREMTQLGVKRPPMMVTADPVLALKPEQWLGKDASLNQEGKQPPWAGFSLRQWKGLEGYKKVIAQAADYLAERGWEVVFLPFHHPDDLAVSRQVAAMMRYPSRVIEEQLTARALLYQVGRMNLLIGMRLHSLVFAAVNGVPMLGVSYDPKVDAFLEALGRRPAGSVSDLSAPEFISRLENLLKRLPREQEHVLQQSERLREKANLTACLALELLANPGGRSTGEKLNKTSPAANYPPVYSIERVGGEVIGRERVRIMGAGVDRVNMLQALYRIEVFISSRQPHQIITLNSELLYRAQNEPPLLGLINQADMVTADGAGIVWAAGHLGTPLPEKVTGIDLTQGIAPLAAQRGWKVFLLGGQPGVAEEAAIRLLDLAPGINIVGTHHGYFKPGAEEEKVLGLIDEKSPDILLVAMGAPNQDYWIRRHLDAGRLRVPVCIGVGGTLDVLAGRVKRAPGWMRRLKLEWLWRLILEPWRWRRMLALPRFVWAVLRIRS